MDLGTPLSTISRPLKMYSSRLEKLGIKTVGDLLYHIPHRYDDFSLISPIGRVQVGETVTVQGTILEIKNEYTKRAKPIQKAIVADESGSMTITWFNQPFLMRTLTKGMNVSLSGKTDFFGRNKTLISPQYEIISQNEETIHTGRLVPIYPETHGVSSKWLRRQIYSLLMQLDIEEYLPENLRKEHQYMLLEQALKTIHFPKTFVDTEKARERLAYDELLTLQVRAVKRRKEWNKIKLGTPFTVETFKKELETFTDSLPFTLTNAQEKAVDAVFSDLVKEKPMNRLLQGDVGSGKTVVAATAMYLAYLNGFQSVLMAPTEILAQQHFKTISTLLNRLGVLVELITGSTKKSDKSKPFDVLVGTHAVLYEGINFHKLGLVVIDEQQRFGVEQRGIIRQKGDNPHVLTMTATPIPRTVALTMYGDLDLSYLHEMPKGRQIIKTWLVPKAKRDSAYEWIRKQIKETDSQVFIICPFIEQSESMQTVKAANVEYERLKKEVFPDLRIGLLHGKMKPKEKDAVLDAFREKAYDVLVATPVVEVGIDIPNATIIVIEASERFGLAQLHQLRGRVGRGDKQSYCLLFTETSSPQTVNKLKSLETTHVGAELAEIDLRLRGPGELYGTLQSGTPELKIASFSDTTLIQQARRDAETLYELLESDEKLQKRFFLASKSTVSPD